MSLLRRRNAYNMVINKFGDRLYNGLVQTQTEHLRAVAAKIEAAQGETFLRELKLRWDHHNKSMQMIRDILMVRPWPTLHHFTLSRAHPHVMRHHKGLFRLAQCSNGLRRRPDPNALNAAPGLHWESAFALHRTPNIKAP